MLGSLDRENVSENNRYSVQLSLRENMLAESSSQRSVDTRGLAYDNKLNIHSDSGLWKCLYGSLDHTSHDTCVS